MTKKIILMLALTILLVGTISASEWDNRGNYNEETKQMIITNALGFGNDIAKVTLNSDLNVQVFPGKNRKVAEFTIEGLQDYTEVFNAMEFYDLNEKGRGTSRTFTYKYKTTEQVDEPIYTNSCSTVDKETTCYATKTGTRKVSKDVWNDFDKEAGLVEGVKTIGIFTTVLPGDYVDWIPTFYGVKINEWATWSATLGDGLVAYYSLDETTGSSTNDSSGAVPSMNGTLYNMENEDWVTGKIGNGLNFSTTGTPENITSANNVDITGANNRSVFAWVNLTSNADQNGIVSWGAVGTGNEFGLSVTPNSGTLRVEALGYSLIAPAGNFLGNNFTFIGMTLRKSSFNSTTGHVRIFVNNTQIAQGNLSLNTINSKLKIGGMISTISWDTTGTIDEVGVWNKTLTSTEITELYNEGEGLSFGEQAGGINVALNQPPSGTSTINSTILLNVSATPTIANMTNITTFIWYQNDSKILNKTFKTFTGSIKNTTTVNITLTKIGIFDWNSQVCGRNSTNGTICNFANSNFTIQKSSFIENSQLFNSNTTEGSTELFGLNLTMDASFFRLSTASLFYNQTEYAGTFTQFGSNYNISRQIVVDGMTAKAVVPFYWQVTLDDGSKQNATAKSQTVNIITADTCTTNTNVLYNFTIVDEITQTIISPTLYNTSGLLNLQIYNLDRSSLIQNLSTNYTKINPFTVCLNNNLSNGEEYSIDVQIQYNASLYDAEFYHIQNDTLNKNDLSSNISLYDLDSGSSQKFKITFKDENFLAVQDALVQIQRKYIEEGVFKTVEIPKTDASGETLGHFQLSDIIYTLIVVKNGEVLGTFNNVIPHCQNPTLETCEISLNSFSSSLDPKDFSQLDDFSFTLTYDKVLREIESIYTIPSGSIATLVLNATLFDALGNQSVCADSLTSSSGTLTCVIPSSFGNSSVIAKLTKDGTLVGQAIISLAQTPEDIFGSNLVFLSLFIMMTLIGVGISDNPMITGFFLLIGAILNIALNLIDSTGFIGTGATILWLVVAVVIVLIKGSGRQ